VTQESSDKDGGEVPFIQRQTLGDGLPSPFLTLRLRVLSP
jgi:hypothetical protein